MQLDSNTLAVKAEHEVPIGRLSPNAMAHIYNQIP